MVHLTYGGGGGGNQTSAQGQKRQISGANVWAQKLGLGPRNPGKPSILKTLIMDELWAHDS